MARAAPSPGAGVSALALRDMQPLFPACRACGEKDERGTPNLKESKQDLAP